MSNPEYAWCDGLVPWEKATCHVSSLAFKYGAAVFEGVRAYWDGHQLCLWQLDAHLERLEQGQRFMRFESPFGADEIASAIKETLCANAFSSDVHITATAFLSGPGQPFLRGPISLAVTAMARGDYATGGLSVQISSWRRSPDAAQPQRIKSNGNYLNGRLAAVQAKTDGYDTALLLCQDGKVSEGPAMAFFMVRGGVVITPDKQSDILESITRDTIIALLQEAGIPVQERKIDHSEVTMADEAFFCGTAWEIAPIRSIDGLDMPAGSPGPITKQLRATFDALTRNQDTSHPEWSTILK